MQNVVYMNSKRNWSVFFHRVFLFCFYLFFVLLFFSAIVSFVTTTPDKSTTPDKFQFQSQVRLSQINAIVPTRLNLNLNFLQSSKHFNCDTIFAVIVSLLNESVHGFNNIRKGRAKTRFQIK